MNQSTIRYTIKAKNFKYHMKKCVMIADGCLISNKNHPVEEVENIKHKLIDKGMLIKVKGGYKLKKNYSTGVLMAYNLCSSKKESMLSDELDVVINGNKDSDEDIKKYFAIKNIVPSSSCFGVGIKKHELKLQKIEMLKCNKVFLERTKNKDFSIVEKFVVECLLKVRIIDKYRRGDDNKKEADIVIDKEIRQIEIVTDFNVANNVLRFKKKIPELAMLIDAVDTEHYKSTDIMKKFYEKDYCSNYSLELAILFFGSQKTVGKMIELIKEEITNNGEPKNQYKKIHFIYLDSMEDRIICFSDSYSKEIGLNEMSIKPYSKEVIDIKKVFDNSEYLLTCSSLFESKNVGMYLTGKEIKEKIKEMKIWI